MLLTRIDQFCKVTKPLINRYVQRNLGITAVALQKATASDPIQKLFLDKLHEYVQKSRAQGTALVDSTPETQKEIIDELKKLAAQYGDGSDINRPPTFQFTEPKLDSINMEVKK